MDGSDKVKYGILTLQCSSRGCCEPDLRVLPGANICFVGQGFSPASISKPKGLPYIFRHLAMSPLAEKDKKFACVVVAIPVDNIFDYLIPEPFLGKIKIGMRVLVPFGRRRAVGYVVGLSDKAKVVETREIQEILDEETSLNYNLLKLTRWMADYYFSSWGMVIKTSLPSSFNTVLKSKKSRASKYQVLREPEDQSDSKLLPSSLTRTQLNTLKRIKESIHEGGFRTFLLHIKPGSLRREIYLEAIEQRKERGAIVLVPEISLIQELLMSFRSKFGGAVSVLHSGLSESERLNEWRRIHRGEADIVIGARSAIFAPLRKVGLIIVDEEHDPSYKLEDGIRYHVRDVAIMRGKIENATVILGSETPSLESFYNAKRGRYQYLDLTENVPRPSISLVDISREKNLLSEKLRQEISERLKKKEKVLLLLNRKGYSPFLLCRECSFTPSCPNCSITLTYHKELRRDKELTGPVLHCHYCNYSTSPPSTCPDCGGISISFIGAGIERVEEEIRRLYPDINLSRIERDLIGRKRIAQKIPAQDPDIILGTQMVLKRESLSPVTLGGIIWADRELHNPDFRSAERTFQIVSQLARRVGTGDVIIQTSNPDNYVLRYAKDYDYMGFYRDEMKIRKELKFPPFSRLVRVTFKSEREERLLMLMHDLKGIINRVITSDFRLQTPDFKGLDILGPAQAYPYKLKGKFRWHMIIKGNNITVLHRFTSGLIEMVKERKYESIKSEVDVDPVKMI